MGIEPMTTVASSEPTGARDGNRTHDHSLTKTVRYRCATRAGHLQVGSEGFEPPKSTDS